MKLKKLLKDLPDVTVHASKDVEIIGIATNSKLVSPGNLFIAKRGARFDGTKFIFEAIQAGAVAVVTDLFDPFLENVVQIITPDVASLEVALIERFYDAPWKKLFLIGVTGTNGKTTTCYLIRHGFETLKIPCGLIGTVESIVGKNVYPSTMTTYDLNQTAKLLQEMVQAGVMACAMEVSSHALEQQRLGPIVFDVALFTNLTQDHLDYHGSMQEYAAAKAKLFTRAKHTIVNADSPWSASLCPSPTFTYGIDQEAMLKATKITLTEESIHCTLNGSCPLQAPLTGKFNLYNLLAATSALMAYPHSLSLIAKSFAHFDTVPGRLERVLNARGIYLFVDYAHTEDALFNVLSTLHALKKGRLITLFGCGGDRDKDKRAKMGRVAEELSDITLITSDNPRGEDPQQIIREILSGFQNPGFARIVEDRKEAIEQAIHLAQAGDIVLIAGKGHETSQVFSHQTLTFDDRKIASQFLAQIPLNAVE